MARICAITDAFDALTSRRPYKEAWPPEDAWRELNERAGRTFDPGLCSAFASVAGDVERIRVQFGDGGPEWLPAEGAVEADAWDI